MRFTHANRHCPDHPYDILKRCEDEFLMSSQPEEQSTEILKWLQKYREDRQHQLQMQTVSPSPNTSRKTPKRSASSKGNDENKKRLMATASREEYDAIAHELVAMSPSKAHRKGLMCEMDMNAVAGIANSSTPVQVAEVADLSAIMGSPISGNKPKHCRPKVILWKEPLEEDDDPLNSSGSNELRMINAPVIEPEAAAQFSPVKKSFNPKKKWLRDAWQEDLGARPLDGYGANCGLNNWQMASTSSSNDSASGEVTANPNQNRPSVLIMGPHSKAPF